MSPRECLGISILFLGGASRRSGGTTKGTLRLSAQNIGHGNTKTICITMRVEVREFFDCLWLQGGPCRYHTADMRGSGLRPPPQPPQGKIKKLEVEAREHEARSETHKLEREDLENKLAEAEVGLSVRPLDCRNE